MRRFGAFSAIGVASFVVQTGLLVWLTRVHGWHHGVALPVTAEVTVLMSFVWHSRWTWVDRPAGGARLVARRLARYQAVKVMAMIAGYVTTMAIVSFCGCAPEVANAVSAALVGMSNVSLADRLVCGLCRQRLPALSIIGVVRGVGASCRG